MNYCSDCGSEVKDTWKHCASCGFTLEKPNNDTDDLRTKTNANVSGISDLDVSSHSSTQPSIADSQFEMSYQESVNDNSDGITPSSNKALKISLLVILLVIGLMLIPAINKSGSSSTEEQACQTDSSIYASSPACKTPQQIAEEAQDAESAFIRTISSYRANNCKPKITRPGPEFRDTMADMDPHVDSVVEDLALKVMLDPAKYSDWGNEADRTLLVTAAYHYKLSELYWEIFGLWRSEMSKFKSSFNTYLSKVDSTARQLCYSYEPTAKQIENSSNAFTKLSSGYSEFMLWWNKANDKELELSQELDEWTEGNKPKCQEYATDNPNFNIVKCTNLP